MKAMRTVKRFLWDQKGTETVEWAIIIALIAGAAIAIMVSISTKVKEKFQALLTALGG